MRATGSTPSMRLISSLFALSLLLVLQGHLFQAQGQGRKFTRAQRQEQKQLRQRQNTEQANLLSSLVSQRRNATETVSVSRATWRGIPGEAKDIAIGSLSMVWVIGTNKTPGGYGIYQWLENRWQGIDGGAVRIAVGTYGAPWVVDSARRIFRRVYKRSGSIWTEMPGRATDIGIGGNGAVWIIGANKTPGGYGIYRWVKNRWQGVDGGAVRISVDAKGNPWVVNSSGKISRRENDRWIGIPGKATDIGIGSSGVVWSIGANKVAGGFGVFRWHGNQWFPVGGGGVQIGVGPVGTPWVVKSDNRIFSIASGGKPEMVSSYSEDANRKKVNQQAMRHHIEMQQLKQRQLGQGGPTVAAGRPGPSQQFTPAQLRRQRRMQRRQARSYRSLRERHRQERRDKGSDLSAAERARQLRQYNAQQRQHRMQLMRLQQRQLGQNRGQGGPPVFTAAPLRPPPAGGGDVFTPAELEQQQQMQQQHKRQRADLGRKISSERRAKGRNRTTADRNRHRSMKSRLRLDHQRQFNTLKERHLRQAQARRQPYTPAQIQQQRSLQQGQSLVMASFRNRPSSQRRGQRVSPQMMRQQMEVLHQIQLQNLKERQLAQNPLR